MHFSHFVHQVWRKWNESSVLIFSILPQTMRTCFRPKSYFILSRCRRSFRGTADLKILNTTVSLSYGRETYFSLSVANSQPHPKRHVRNLILAQDNPHHKVVPVCNPVTLPTPSSVFSIRAQNQKFYHYCIICNNRIPFLLIVTLTL